MTKTVEQFVQVQAQSIFIQTPRLTLRPPLQIDKPYLDWWWENDEAALYLLNRKSPFVDAQIFRRLRQAVWVKKSPGRKKSPDGAKEASIVTFIPSLKMSHDIPLGVAVLDSISREHGYVYMRLFIRKTCRHYGFGMETLIGLLQFAFDELGMRNVVGELIRRNMHSWQMLRKCGFECAGVLEKMILYRNRHFDLDILQLKRERWKHVAPYLVRPEELKDDIHCALVDRLLKKSDLSQPDQ